MAKDFNDSSESTVSGIMDGQGETEKPLEADGTNDRNTKRAMFHVLLLVSGSDADNRPFREEAETVNVNERGCLTSLETPVVHGQRLVVVNLGNHDERECRVVRLGKLLRGKRQVAIEFLCPAPEFWFDS